MRVLMLCDLYPPSQGGIEHHVHLLSRELVRRGHEVAVCTIGREGLPPFEEVEGVRIYRLMGFFQTIPFIYRDDSRRWPPPAYDWAVSRELGDILERERPDIIHAHGWMVYSLPRLRKRWGIPLVYTAHDYRLFCPKMILLRNDSVCRGPSFLSCLTCLSRDFGLPRAILAWSGVKYNRRRLQDVDALVAPSCFVRDSYEHHLPAAGRDSFTIPNFIPAYTHDASTSKVILPNDFILFVGWLMPHKGVDVLLESYRGLATETELVVIGIEHASYSYRSEGRIRVLRNAPHEVVIEAMSRCRFAVVPSICPECFATVASEAMSQGKAVIASRIGGLPEIVIDGETGVLVHPNSAADLRQAMSTLLDSPDTADAMGQRGYRSFIDNYTPEVVVPRFIEMYQQVVDRSRGER